jgi:hypothetical protein
VLRPAPPGGDLLPTHNEPADLDHHLAEEGEFHDRVGSSKFFAYRPTPAIIDTTMASVNPRAIGESITPSNWKRGDSKLPGAWPATSAASGGRARTAHLRSSRALGWTTKGDRRGSAS